MLLLLIGSVYYFVMRKKQSFVHIFLLLSFIFLILAFGGDSPLYFLFGMFPFNMFRTPSKYLLVSVFFLILYASFIFKEIIKKQRIVLLFVYCALVVNCCILIRTAFNYHVFVDAQKLFSTLNKYSNISSDSSYFIFGGGEEWLKTFSARGWKTNKDRDPYLFMNSALLPNSNLIAGLSTFDVYTGGLKMRRSEYLKSTITTFLSEYSMKQEDETSSIKFEHFLQLYNIGTIISFKPLFLPHFNQIKSETKYGITITAMQNLESKSNLFYVPHTVKSLLYIEDVEKEIAQETVSEDNSFTESLPATIKQNARDVNIKIIKQNDQLLKSAIGTKEKKFIVVKKGWYPEWHLFIDGKESVIYKTNLIHMGFYVPSGHHIVEFVYIPTSFYVGCGTALLGIIVVVAYVISKKPTKTKGA